MKKLFLRVFIALFVIICVSTAGGIWYAKNVFLPKKLKPLLIEAAEKSTGFKIKLENIAYKFPGVFVVYDFTLFEKEIPAQKLLTAQTIAVQFKLPAILLKKELVINKVELKTLQIYPGPGRTFTSRGDLYLDGQFSYNLKEPGKISYEAIVTLKNHDIKNMPLVKDISNLNGRIKIEADKISIIQLKGASYDCPVEFAGYLENFKDPYLDLTETIDLDLAKINYFLSAKISKFIKQIELSGKSAVALNMSGKLSQWPLKFNGHAKVIDGQAKMKMLSNPITAINGSAGFDEKSLSIPEITALYNEQRYTFKANLSDFSAPNIYAVLTSQDLLIETKLQAQEDFLRFDAIDGNWFNSSLNLSGEMQNYQDPQLKLFGSAKIELEDAQKIASRILGENEKIQKFLNALKPKGVCDMSLFLDCLINNFTNCELGIKASSENINLRGFNLGALDMTAQLKNKALAVPKLDLAPYSGALKIQCQADFASKNNPAAPTYDIQINAADVDLGKLIKDTDFKKKDVWGTLSMSCSLNGAGYDLNNLKGDGWLLVSNGHLWEFPLLGGIAEALRLPMLRKVEIKEAAGNFTVRDKTVRTQNLQFLSPQLNMLARGNLGFDGGLDFNIGVSFAPGFAAENELAKLAMLLVDETGKLIGQLKLAGTIKEPKYKFIPLHLDKILKNQLIKGIQKIFKRGD